MIQELFTIMFINKQEHIESKWYVFYTKSRFEKSVFKLLTKSGIEAFLPLKKELRKWSDRKKIVEVPVLSSYIFVKIPKYKILDVLKYPGISRYISFNGLPATIREKDIELLKKAIENNNEIELVDSYLTKGSKVKFISGAFANYEAVIIKHNKKNKIIVEIEGLNQSILITVDKCQLKAS